MPPTDTLLLLAAQHKITAISLESGHYPQMRKAIERQTGQMLADHIMAEALIEEKDDDEYNPGGKVITVRVSVGSKDQTEHLYGQIETARKQAIAECARKIQERAEQFGLEGTSLGFHISLALHATARAL